MALQIKAKLLYNKRVKNNYFHCALAAPKIAKEARPGQFVMLKAGEDCQPLLRRPLGIHSLKGQAIELLYEVVGQGTEILSHKKPGEYLDIIGPLGNGFNYRLPFTVYRLPILVAGGMGVAPLVFLGERLITKSPSHQVTRKPLVLLGAKTKSHILCEKEFRKLGCNVKIATDNGSSGLKGKVTDLLKHLLSTIDYRLSTIYACGPHPMLKGVAAVAKKYDIPAQLSLEEHMACGIGACFGCAVDTIDGYKRVCRDGPVFQAQGVIWRAQ